MTPLVKRCPQDGAERPLNDAGSCPTCNGPLQLYCPTHSEWLTDQICRKCNPRPAPAVAGSRVSADAIFITFAVLVLAGLIFLSYVGYRYLTRKPSAAIPVTSSAPPVKPVVQRPPPISRPAPAPQPPRPIPAVPVVVPQTQFPAYPPVNATLTEVLRDPDRYVGKLVKIRGAVQAVDLAKKMFDLQEGSRTLPVLFDRLAPAAGTTVTVTGLLQVREDDNSSQLLAQTIEPR